MKISRSLLPALAILLSLSACSGQTGSDPAVTARPEGAAPAPAAAPVKTEAEVSNGPNTLVIKPGHVFACDGRDRAVSTISWRSTDPAVSRVAIKVQAPEGGESKVFTIGGSEGSAETGNWMTPGVRVAMVDEPTGKELASHTVTAYPCN
jgi:hypothetical protein